MNKHVKRGLPLLIPVAVIAAAALLALSLLGGKIGGMRREIRTGDQYTHMDIRHAMAVVEWRFRFGFRGCRLLELTYDEEFSAARSDEWAAQYGAEEAIVLTSSLEVGESGGSLNPNSTYRNWQWILTRGGGGFWKLQTCGYG